MCYRYLSKQKRMWYRYHTSVTTLKSSSLMPMPSI
uniref:Uncharacterized protein n=1 Tax=Arundo donax TaxID=35708 RepID=A0A0A8ZFZ5_ARUDO